MQAGHAALACLGAHLHPAQRSPVRPDDDVAAPERLEDPVVDPQMHAVMLEDLWFHVRPPETAENTRSSKIDMSRALGALQPQAQAVFHGGEGAPNALGQFAGGAGG